MVLWLRGFWGTSCSKPTGAPFLTALCHNMSKLHAELDVLVALKTGQAALQLVCDLILHAIAKNGKNRVIRTSNSAGLPQQRAHFDAWGPQAQEVPPLCTASAARRSETGAAGRHGD